MEVGSQAPDRAAVGAEHEQVDADNRLPPPKGARTLGLEHPWTPVEGGVDHEVRADLDRWVAEGSGIAFAETRDYVEEVMRVRTVYAEAYPELT